MRLMRIYAERRKEDRRQVLTEVMPPSPRPEEEEISLIDVIIVLVHHRWLMAGVMVASLLAGLAVALTKVETFTYTTTIQIAKGANGPIESPGTVLAKLNESYIPLVLQREHVESPGGRKIKIQAKIPRDSQVISLESRGRADDQPRQAQLHQSIIDQLIKDHDQELNAIRRDLQSEGNLARSQIEALKAENGLLKEKSKRLDEQERFFQGEVATIHKRIDQNQTMRHKLLQDGGDTSTSAVMLLDGELSRLSQRESELNEQMMVSINGQRDDLRAKDLDNAHQQADLQEKLEQLNTKLASIAPTRAVTATLRSLDPAGTKPLTVMAIALVAGAMLAIFSAFLAELVTRARERLRAEHA